MLMIIIIQMFDKVDEAGEVRCYVLRILGSKKTAV